MGERWPESSMVRVGVEAGLAQMEMSSVWRYRTVGLKVENDERVVRITMDRPPLNVLDIPLLRELDAALTACAEDTGTDVMVIQGAGQRAFSAGVDIRDHTRENVPEMLDVVHGVIRKLFAVPQSHHCLGPWGLSWWGLRIG